VPRLASFDGVVVKPHFGDHPPPHFHAYVGRVGRPGLRSSRFSIETGEPLDGQLPSAKVAAVRSWRAQHREELLVDWERARLYEHPIGRYDR
jgi:hypothetical protein